MDEDRREKKFSAVTAVKIASILTGVILVSIYLIYHFFFLKPYGLSPGIKYITSPSYEKGEDWNGDYLWYGGIKWRVLDKSDVLLLADHIPEAYYEEWSKMSYIREDPEEEYPVADWDGSVVREYLNTDFYASAFAPEERDAILYKYQDIGWKIPEDKIFLFAWDDVISERYGFSGEDKQRSYEEDWWLCQRDGSVYVADSGGIVELLDVREAFEKKAVRPAFYLDEESVVFARDASFDLNRPPSSVLMDTRLEGKNSGEWIPVLSSAAQHVTVCDIRLEGGVCTMTYCDASWGKGRYLSAVITDRDGDIRYYGRLAEMDSGPDGSASAELPDQYKISWSLSVFSENPGEGTMTSYASDPVAVLEGKEPVEGRLSSVGRCDPDHEPEPLDMIIDRYYDRYLNWHAEDYEEADEEERHEAGTAALLYAGLCSENSQLIQEDGYTEGEIRDGAQYADEHPEDVQIMTEMFFEQARQDDMTMKELMDRNYGLEHLDAYEGDIDLWEYTEYMDYTGAMFQAAGRDEQENVLIAAFLYLRKYRLGEEITAEYAADLAEQIHHSEAMEEDMELSMMQEFIEMNPDRTVREMMNTNMDFSPH